MWKKYLNLIRKIDGLYEKIKTHISLKSNACLRFLEMYLLRNLFSFKQKWFE